MTTSGSDMSIKIFFSLVTLCLLCKLAMKASLLFLSLNHFAFEDLLARIEYPLMLYVTLSLLKSEIGKLQGVSLFQKLDLHASEERP